MNIIDAEGVKLNYLENGTGPTVVLIHGVIEDYRAWGAQVEVLSKRFRTISYSRRCAFPNQNRDFANSSVENNAKDLVELIAKTGGGPVHLIGHSYGGAVAALCALKNPGLVRSLVLIEPHLVTMLIKDPDSLAQNLSLLLRKPSAALSRRKILKKAQEPALQALDQKNDEKALQLILDGLQDRQNAIQQYSERDRVMMRDNAETIREVATKPPRFTKAEAKRISQPTLLLTGEWSIKMYGAIVEELHRTMPNNQSVTIRNAWHMPHIENPGACSEEILKFLAEHAA